MDLYKAMLAEYIAEHGNLDTIVDADKILENLCYQALCRIKAVLEDDTLDDLECFMRIEEIVCVFEEMGSDGGSRHDFG